MTSIIKDYENYQWQVFYRHLDENSSKEEKSIRANFVIISAGALGSSKILLQSRERGLEVSSETGRKFNGNGGMFGKFRSYRPSQGKCEFNKFHICCETYEVTEHPIPK